MPAGMFNTTTFRWQGRAYSIPVNHRYLRVVTSDREVLEITWPSTKAPAQVRVTNTITERLPISAGMSVDEISYVFVCLIATEVIRTPVAASFALLLAIKPWDYIQGHEPYLSLPEDVRIALAPLFNRSPEAIADVADEPFSLAGLMRAKASICRYLARHGFGETFAGAMPRDLLAGRSRAGLAQELNSGLWEQAERYDVISSQPIPMAGRISFPKELTIGELYKLSPYMFYDNQ